MASCENNNEGVSGRNNGGRYMREISGYMGYTGACVCLYVCIHRYRSRYKDISIYIYIHGYTCKRVSGWGFQKCGSLLNGSHS